MSYSLDKLPNVPYEFPAPPKFLVWIEEERWNRTTRTYERASTPTGQVRHFPDLTRAKKRISNYARHHDTFVRDWAIYLWDDEKGEYVVQYEGKRGEGKNLNPLFRTRVRKGDPAPRPGFEEEEAAAIASILESAR